MEPVPEAETIWELSSEVPINPILSLTFSVVSGQAEDSAVPGDCTQDETCLLNQSSLFLKNEMVCSGDEMEAS